jgi:hypothetical protein
MNRGWCSRLIISYMEMDQVGVKVWCCVSAGVIAPEKPTHQVVSNDVCLL